jgi:hypothetical protein
MSEVPLYKRSECQVRVTPEMKICAGPLFAASWKKSRFVRRLYRGTSLIRKRDLY